MTNKQQLREEKLIEIAEAYSHYPEPDKKTIQAMREYASYVLQEEMEGLRKAIEAHQKTNTYEGEEEAVFRTTIKEILSLIPRNENE